MMDDFNFDSLKNLDVPQNWVKNALDVPQTQKKEKPVILVRYTRIFATVASIVLVCVLSVVLYMHQDQNVVTVDPSMMTQETVADTNTHAESETNAQYGTDSETHDDSDVHSSVYPSYEEVEPPEETVGTTQGNSQSTNLPSQGIPVPTQGGLIGPTLPIEPTQDETIGPVLPVDPTEPVIGPTQKPTVKPTVKPTQKPTKPPVVTPTVKPTQKPTSPPVVTPTVTPTQKPDDPEPSEPGCDDFPPPQTPGVEWEDPSVLPTESSPSYESIKCTAWFSISEFEGNGNIYCKIYNSNGVMSGDSDVYSAQHRASVGRVTSTHYYVEYNATKKGLVLNSGTYTYFFYCSTGKILAKGTLVV